MPYATDGNIGAQIGVAFSSLVDGKSQKLGTIMNGDDGSKFMLVQAAGASIAQYAVVSITEAGTAVAITAELATLGQAVGVAEIAAETAEFFWVRQLGQAGPGDGMHVKVSASVAADVQLYTSDTAGQLDDSVTATQSLVHGIRIITLQASSTVTETAGVGATCIATNSFGTGWRPGLAPVS